MSRSFDLFVAGHGLVASTLALRLAEADFKVGWCTRGARELSPGLAFRTLSVAPSHIDTLVELGLSSVLTEHASYYQQMQLWSDVLTLQQAVTLKAADTGQGHLGAVLPMGPWLAALHQRLLDHSGVTELTIAPDQLATWQDKQCLGDVQAPLLVIADGPASPWLQASGFSSQSLAYHDYGQSAWCGVATTAQAHGGITRQRFLASGPLALLPLKNEHQVGVVWTQTPEAAETMKAKSAKEQAASLLTASDGVLGEMQQVEHSHAFALSRWHANQYAKSRVIRIGESAHGVHPLAGLGGNMGLWDADALLKACYVAREQGKDLGGFGLLSGVARQRHAANRRRQIEIDAIGKLSTTSNRAQKQLQHWAAASFQSPAGPVLAKWVTGRASSP